MRTRDDSGQIKFWQVFIVILIVGLIAFDLLSPQLAKVQLKDKAEAIALQESKAFVSSPSTYSAKYYGACDTIRREITGYGARIVPTPDQAGYPPEEICPTIDDDGRIKFTVEKTAPTLVLGRIMKNYNVVTVEVDEKFTV